MVKIVLTADRSLMTDYHDVEALGFGLCLPRNLVPDLLEYLVLAPKMRVDREYRAVKPPYALRKVEAALLQSGFTRNDVTITAPEYVSRVIDDETIIVGIYTVSPLGLSPVPWTLRCLTAGEDPLVKVEFEKLMKKLNKLKKRYKFKIVVGGPGAWELRGFENIYGIDILFEGEGEITFPEIVYKLMSGEELPKHVIGIDVPIDKIPIIQEPSRGGHVQITRGCPRRCKFCSPTMFKFRSIPIDKILKEIEVQLSIDNKQICFITEDVLLYGASSLKVNSDAVIQLFKKSKELIEKSGKNIKLTFCHVNAASIRQNFKLVKEISEIAEHSENNVIFPQIGIESASPSIISKYFRGKIYPYKPVEWGNIIVEVTKFINDHYWYPCYTYIIGFPDEKSEDHKYTIKLVEEIMDLKLKCWIFPMILVPMGGSLLDKKVDWGKLERLNEKAWELIYVSTIHSLRFSREVIPKVFSIRNTLIKKILLHFVNCAIKGVEEYLRLLKENPHNAINMLKSINVRHLHNLAFEIVRYTLQASVAKHVFQKS